MWEWSAKASLAEALPCSVVAPSKTAFCPLHRSLLTGLRTQCPGTAFPSASGTAASEATEMSEEGELYFLESFLELTFLALGFFLFWFSIRCLCGWLVLRCPGCPGTCYVHHVGLEWKQIYSLGAGIKDMSPAWHFWMVTLQMNACHPPSSEEHSCVVQLTRYWRFISQKGRETIDKFSKLEQMAWEGQGPQWRRNRSNWRKHEGYWGRLLPASWLAVTHFYNGCLGL